MVTKNNIVLLALLGVSLVSLLILPGVFALEPTGATVTPGTPMTAPNDTADSEWAYAGNITELDIFGISTTQSWQGYFGNVTGVLQLADTNDNVMYNWSVAKPQGQVYASTNSTIQWPEIQCFNYTAEGTNVGVETPGETSLYGMNLTQLQTQYNISWDDSDAVNETFYLLGAGGHHTFYTATKQFSAGECQSTRVYDNSGSGVDNNFEEALLYEPTTSSVIFASLLKEGGFAGFDGALHDFEMMVLDNGHGTDTIATLYYFFVEIQ